MPFYDVETDLIVHTKVKVRVEAASKDDAIDAVAEIIPNNYDPDTLKGWGAKIIIKSPKGVEIVVGRSFHLAQASGGEKVRKVGD